MSKKMRNKEIINNKRANLIFYFVTMVWKSAFKESIDILIHIYIERESINGYTITVAILVFLLWLVPAPV